MMNLSNIKMKNSEVFDCTMLELSKHHRTQGNLSVVKMDVPFK